MRTLEQMEFEVLVSIFQPAIAKRAGKAGKKILATGPEQFAVVLLRATTEENIAFSTYAIMMAVHRHGAIPPSLAAITVETGYSYWAVRNQVDRTPWFIKTHSDLVRLGLTEEAKLKLERVTRRIARYA